MGFKFSSKIALTMIGRLPVRYPIIRGMLSYAIIWPCSSLTQEYLEYGVNLEKANWARAGRFGCFGAFFMSPVLYTWLKLSGKFFKQKTLATAVKRALLEQISYCPFALAYFLFGMSIMEGKKVNESIEEVKVKFWQTYKVGVLYWPTAQTINFYFIKEQNRIVFMSIVSYIFTTFLAHMKSHRIDNK